NGKVLPVGRTPLTPDAARELVECIMDEGQRLDFNRNKELNFAIGSQWGARFRVSAFYQRNDVGMVLRRIETVIPTIEELQLPPILTARGMTKRRIIISVGATGTGKSPTLAETIGHRNRHALGHIISIQDPIEYVQQQEGCNVTQR